MTQGRAYLKKVSENCNNFFHLVYAGTRPRLHHHYRGRKLSIWLNLLPQLQKTGQNTIYPSHNSLVLNHSDPFTSWGIIQNSSISSASNILDSRSVGAAATACSTSGVKARNQDVEQVSYNFVHKEFCLIA